MVNPTFFFKIFKFYGKLALWNINRTNPQSVCLCICMYIWRERESKEQGKRESERERERRGEIILRNWLTRL